MAFIDAYQGDMGIEPICRELAIAPSSEEGLSEP
jgi:hypothetical protein